MVRARSGGGTVMQVYLLQHPDTVRTAIINDSTLIDYPIFEHMAETRPLFPI
jgi:hypothetical protein